MTFITHTAIMSASLETVSAQPPVQLCAREAELARRFRFAADVAQHTVNGTALDRVEVGVVSSGLERSSERSSARMIPSSHVIVARSRTLCSSRTLPGQS